MTFDSREHRGLIRRKLRFALICSLFLHGVLFSLGGSHLVQQGSTSGSAPRLIAHLRLAPVAMVPVTPIVTAKPPHVPMTHPLAHPRLMPRVLTSVSPDRQAPQSFKVPVAQLPARALPMTETGLTEPERSAAAPGMPVAVINDQQGDLRDGRQTNLQNPASAAGLSADGLRRYRMGLAAQSRRFKRYPAQALAAGWAGTVEIFLAVDSAGQAVVTLNKSSGHEALDRAAQTMIEAGAQHTPVPDVLRGKAFSVVLPVVFDINDG